MEKSISFPHLGIFLKDVGNHITIFGFDVAFYGMMIGLGILAGLAIIGRRARKSGQSDEDYYDMIMYAVITSVIGARIYYVAFSWEAYKDDLLSVFNIRQGGLAIYGSVIAAVITVFLFAKKRQLSPYVMIDTAAPGLVMGQAIGRWGNFFNREAFGEYTDSLMAMRLPLDAVRSSDVTELMRENIIADRGISWVQMHPTFLYESLWCLLVFFILWMWDRKKVFHGELFLLYTAGYGLGRFFIEGLRTDQLLIPGSGIPVSQALAGTMCVVASLVIAVMRNKYKKAENR